MKAAERSSNADEVHPPAACIRIRVNGEIRRLAAGTALADFLTEQDVPAQFVAVAVNSEVVPRADHACTILADGDVVEIVRMVGGGSGRRGRSHAARVAAAPWRRPEHAP